MRDNETRDALQRRSARASEELEIELDTFHQLRVNAETIATALTAQRELAKQKSSISVNHRRRRNSDPLLLRE